MATMETELYHVLNRGVDKRRIFMENGDYVRFVHGLYKFNDTEPANNTSWYLERTSTGISPVHVRPRTNNDLRGRYGEGARRKRKPLVEIHGWCLMGNHYHLLLSELRDKGISRFLMKLNVGYAKYFNEKYKRAGTLFQGRSKKVLIKRDAHFLHILHYIHLNPLDFLKGASDWRAGKISRGERALSHLDSYRWSSFNDYCGRKNFPSILTTNLFGDVFSNYRKTISAYLKDMDFSAIQDVPLE